MISSTGELLNGIQEVRGSTPLGSTNWRRNTLICLAILITSRPARFPAYRHCAKRSDARWGSGCERKVESGARTDNPITFDCPDMSSIT
jgi:hypothetical protein